MSSSVQPTLLTSILISAVCYSSKYFDQNLLTWPKPKPPKLMYRSAPSFYYKYCFVRDPISRILPSLKPMESKARLNITMPLSVKREMEVSDECFRRVHSTYSILWAKSKLSNSLLAPLSELKMQ